MTILTVLASVLLVVVIVIFSLAFTYQQKRTKETSTHLAWKYFITRTFIFDFNTHRVTSFNMLNLEERKTMMFPKFFDMFDKACVEKVRNWIDSLIENPDIINENEENKLFTANESIFENVSHIKIVKVLLECTHIDKEKKQVYINIYTLKNSPTSYINSKNKLIDRNNVFLLEDVERNYNLGDYDRGSIFIVSFFTHDSENTSSINYGKFRHFCMDQINRLSGNQQFKFFNDGNIDRLVFIDLHPNNNNDSLKKYIGKFKPCIEHAIECAGYVNKLDYHIYGGLINELPNKFNQTVEVFTRLMSLEKDTTKKYDLYKKEDSRFLFSTEGYRHEIEKLIRHQNVIVQYRPIIELVNNGVVEVGYMSFVKPSSRTVFKSLAEVKTFVTTYEKEEEYLSLILKMTLTTFKKEIERTGLPISIFVHIGVKEIDIAKKIIEDLRMIEKSLIVLSFSSSEFIDIETNETIMNKFSELKKEGYEIALETSTNDHILKNQTYRLFNYFIFNTDIGDNIKFNSIEFLKAHQFLDRIVKYEVPIISSDAPNIQTIDLFYKAGITYFSSDVIAPRNYMIKPIDKKIIKKLNK